MDEAVTPSDEPLALNSEHLDATHDRWIKLRNRPLPGPDEDWPDWAIDQCGGRRYYVPLRGKLSSDWGACTNAASPRDGRVMFEHDGCDAYEGASEWVGAYISRNEDVTELLAAADNIVDRVERALRDSPDSPAKGGS